jgi:hypothetical protein
VLEDSCGLDDGSFGDNDGFFSLVNTGEGTFTVVPDDTGEAFSCTLAGVDYTCDPRIQEQEDLGKYGFDAVVTVTIAPSGTFLTASTMDGQQNGEASCEGTDCATAAAVMQLEFPCILTVAFTAENPG